MLPVEGEGALQFTSKVFVGSMKKIQVPVDGCGERKLGCCDAGRVNTQFSSPPETEFEAKRIRVVRK